MNNKLVKIKGLINNSGITTNEIVVSLCNIVYMYESNAHTWTMKMVDGTTITFPENELEKLM